jgi:hypothetical protein
MKAISRLRLVCSRCGGKDFEVKLVYTEVELRGFLGKIEGASKATEQDLR